MADFMGDVETLDSAAGGCFSQSDWSRRQRRCYLCVDDRTLEEEVIIDDDYSKDFRRLYSVDSAPEKCMWKRWAVK